MRMWQQHGLFGGHAFLDFVNTVEDPGKSRMESALADWQEVAAFAQAAGFATAAEAEALAALDGEPDAAARLDALLVFRERAWEVLAAIAGGRGPEAGAAEAAGAAVPEDLADRIRGAYARARLVPGENGYRWEPGADGDPAAVLDDRLALALDDLLAHRDLARLGECGRCTGLFLDHGRGVGRRWCRMKTCGNRAKAEAFRGRSSGGA